MTLLEPDVALTDYGLALECALFVWWVRRHGQPESALRFWFIVFFAALGAAALLGGSVHGFVGDSRSLIHALLWGGTLIAIGVAGLAGWGIGARLALSTAGSIVIRVAAIALAGYIVVVLFVAHSFAVAVIYYLPAAAFLLAAFLTVYARQRARWSLIGAGGIALMFIAAAVQQLGIGLHPRYFNHNALYHVFQGIALALLYVAARAALTTEVDRC